MATSYSPKIITDGLVLCLDAADKKSLLAPPTTNLANNSNGTINWTTNSLVGTRTQSTVNADDYHYRFVLDKGSNSYIFFRFAFDHTNLTNGETYIMSYKYKVTSGSGTFQVTDFCDVGVTRVTKDIGDGWYYETAYASRSSYDETYDFFDVQASDNMTVDIKEIQVEHTSASSPLATPFVSYRRQWKDRTGSNNGNFVNMNDQSNFSSDGGGCLSFDGVNDHVSIPNSSSLQLSSNQSFTISYFVNLNRIDGSFMAPVMKNWFGTSYGHLMGTDNEYLLIYTDGDNSVEHYSYGILDGYVNKWLQITQTYDGDRIYVYQNGELYSQSGTGISLTTNTANLYLGTSGGTTYFLDGKMSNVYLYNKALTASEVLQNYNATKGRFGL